MWRWAWGKLVTGSLTEGYDSAGGVQVPSVAVQGKTGQYSPWPELGLEEDDCNCYEDYHDEGYESAVGA
jgi:hypothetical protein